MDILILIALTAFLIYRLMNTLGTKTGEEKKRSFLDEATENIIVLPRKKNQGEEDVKTIPDYQMNMASKIKDVLPDFDVEDFIDNAKNAYQLIIKKFVQGKKDDLKPFVTNSVYDIFCNSIDHLKEQNLEQESEIIDFLSVDIEKTKVDTSDVFDHKACITLLIKTKQINVIYDEKGEIVENPAKISTSIADVWTFERSISSPDPIWLLSKMKRLN